MPKNLALNLRILIPLLLAVLLGFAPRPTSLAEALHGAAKSEDNHYLKGVARNLRIVVDYEPWRTGAWEKIGLAEYGLGNWEEAVLAFQTTASVMALSAAGQYALGESYFNLGDTSTALENWKPLLLAGIAPPALYPRATAYFRQAGDIENAVQVCSAWLATGTMDTKGLLEYGLLLTLTSPEESTTILRSVRSLDARYAAQVNTILDSLRQIGFGDIPESYDKMLIGRALAATGEWDLALIAFRQAKEISPEYAEAWALYGEALQHTGLSGYPELEIARELDPDSVIVQSLFALYWRRRGAPNKAMEFLNMVAEQEPDQAHWQMEIGLTIADQGDLPMALAKLLEAAEMEPHNPTYWREVAKFCARYNIEVNTIGLSSAREALLLDPNDPESLDAMGQVLFTQGDNYTALRFLKDSVKAQPTYALAHLHLAQVYLEIEELQSAFDHLLIAIDYSHGQQEIEQSAQRLLRAYFEIP